MAVATAIRPAGRSDHGYERTVKQSPAHVVVPAEAGQRLDRVVAALPGVGSRRRAWEAVASGKVDVDGVTAAPHEAGRPVPPGAHVTLHWDRPGTSNALAAARRGLGDLAIGLVYMFGLPPALGRSHADLMFDRLAGAAEANR